MSRPVGAREPGGTENSLAIPALPHPPKSQLLTSPLHHLVIAIDGPAASGKSSVAQELARRLKYAYVNSGALYRAATWFILQHEVDPRNGAEVARTLAAAEIACGLRDGSSFIRLDGLDPEPFLRETRINAAVSSVSSVPEVRRLLTERLRRLAEERDVVIEGRDIGSAVFPQTPYKFYIDASQEVRAQRRATQEGGGRDEIAARDFTDSTRRASPLVIAEDAHVIDSSRLTIDGVVGEIIGRLKLKGLVIPAAG
jgi:cytidylate kinase